MAHWKHLFKTGHVFVTQPLVIITRGRPTSLMQEPMPSRALRFHNTEEVIQRLVPLLGLVHVARMTSVRYLVFS